MGCVSCHRISKVTERTMAPADGVCGDEGVGCVLRLL